MWIVVALGLVLVAALLTVRLRTTGHLPPPSFAAAVLVAVAAETVGTTFQVSGPILAVPVIAAIVLTLWRSSWRLGDLASMVIILGLGMGAASLVDYALHPDSGSQADQAAGALLLLGIALAVVTIARHLWRMRRHRRTLQ